MATQNNFNLPKPKEKAEFPFTLDASKKDRDYCLQMAKAQYYWNFALSTGRNAFGNGRRNDYIENRTYADGNPNMLKFVNWVSDMKDEAGNNQTFLNFDLKPVAFIPKFRDIVISYVDKLDYKVAVNAVNPEAANEKEAAKWRIYVTQKLEQWAQKMEALAGTQLVQRPEFEYSFDTKQELDTLYDMSEKMICELEAELGNEIILNESDWKNMKRMLLEDLFDNAACCVETYTESYTGRIRHRYVDVVNIIYPNWEFRGHYLETPSRIGYIDMMTVASLRQQAGNQLTDDDYKAIATQFENQLGNGSVNIPFGSQLTYVNTDALQNYWFNFNVPVMTLYWEETDRVKYKTEKDSTGESYIKPVAFAEKEGTTKYTVIGPDGEKYQREKSVYATDEHYYYMCKWVIGTNYCYNYGKVPNQARNPRNPKLAACPMKLIRTANRSMLERLLPLEESNLLTWIRMQNACAKSVPSGYSLNIASLKNATVDNKALPIKHQVSMYAQTGNLVWSSEDPLDESGRPYPHPIIPLTSNFINDIQGWLTLFDSNIAKMRAVTGINELMDASTPDPRMLAGTAKLAVTGAMNSMYPLIWGITKMSEEMCSDGMQKLKLAVQWGDYEYSDSLGYSLTSHLKKVTPLIAQYTYALKVEAMPTEQEKAELKETAKAAVVNIADPIKGGLYYSDYLYICGEIDAGTNLKVVAQIMNYRIKKNLEKMTKLAGDNSQQQAAAQQQAIQLASRAKMDEMQKEAELEAYVYSQKKIADAQYEREKSQAHTEGKLVTDQQKSNLKKGEEILKTYLEPAQ